MNPSFRSPEQGAATQVWAATSPSLVGKGGLHCEDCAVVGPALSGLPEEEAERLWEYSIGLVSA
ncbi:hypothetical protein JQX13_47750 [Archangium violaceum]|uniref:hypothetical protein n=1 Tax=Archangium violaceum TaxID=83451 RepID=UPI00193BEB29|nr:hypothetical protein [Archangium violaceum]QRK07609.1 hypothetical protein JQX13_47750 [Archangium violaceum]